MFDWLVKLACVLRTPTVGQSIPTFCLKNTFLKNICLVQKTDTSTCMRMEFYKRRRNMLQLEL